jgi:hypothetical protein
MKTGVWNLGFGLVGIAAGAGGYVLPGTTDPRILMALGGLIAALGVYQLWRARGQ